MAGVLGTKDLGIIEIRTKKEGECLKEDYMNPSHISLFMTWWWNISFRHPPKKRSPEKTSTPFNTGENTTSELRLEKIKLDQVSDSVSTSENPQLLEKQPGGEFVAPGGWKLCFLGTFFFAWSFKKEILESFLGGNEKAGKTTTFFFLLGDFFWKDFAKMSS